MSFLQDLKTNKATQQKVLDKLGSMPRFVNGVATMANVGARALSPFYAIGLALNTHYRKKVISLDRTLRDKLQVKRDKYVEMMKEKSDSYGFIDWEECDSLLFTGLVGSVGCKTVITAARDSDGAWHRRPVDYPECYVPGDTGSSISRDMLLGLLWYIWRNQRLDLANDLWVYGKEHNWIMGEGDVSRIYMTPGLQATLAEIIYQLGGNNYWFSRKMPQSWPLNLEGYQAHLEILHILLLGELRGFITPGMEEALYNMCERYPRNYLAVLARAIYADRKTLADDLGTQAAVGMMDVSLWPDNSLPSDADRSSRWIFENDVFDKGTDPTEFHTGGDMVFCGSLILEYSDYAE